MPTQLTLPVQLRDHATFSNFYSDANPILLAALKEFCLGRAENYVYLWGNPGVGCTHLLHACCHELQAQGLQVVYLSLSEKDINPSILEGLENLELVCIDDFDTIAGNRIWEEALFHFFNRMQANKHRLLIAAKKVPQQLDLLLPDLTSRLASGMLFQVQELTETEKLNALQLRAHLRGFELSMEVGQFLLKRMPRDFSSLMMILDKMDEMSLIKKRKLTIPMIKEMLLI